MKHVFFLGLFSSLTWSCGHARTSDPSVIGGQPLTAPTYFAALHKEGDGKAFCGASLIAPHVLLTAAHCVNFPDRYLEAWLAVDDLRAPPHSRSIEAIVVHPRYHAGEIRHDLALAFLRPDQRFKSQAIAISHQSASDGPLRVLGFGNTSRRGARYPLQLLAAELEELALPACRAWGEAFTGVTSEQICARDGLLGRYDSCDGDSGGPLLARDRAGQEQLYGLVSWGIGCGEPGVPGIYTRVASYRSWIDQTIDAYAKQSWAIDQLAQAVFYAPLRIAIEGGHRSFSAAYHLWKPAQKRGRALQHWQREDRGRTLRLSLYAEGSRYLLQLVAAGQVWESTATYHDHR